MSKNFLLKNLLILFYQFVTNFLSFLVESSSSGIGLDIGRGGPVSNILEFDLNEGVPLVGVLTTEGSRSKKSGIRIFPILLCLGFIFGAVLRACIGISGALLKFFKESADDPFLTVVLERSKCFVLGTFLSFSLGRLMLADDDAFKSI